MKKETKQPREEIWSCGDCGDRVFPNGEHICHKKPRECCEKCYDVYFEKDWPAHTAYPCCTNEICECHKPIPAEKNFLQVGRTIECGTCHPEKFGDCKELRRIYKFDCGCKCHDKVIPPSLQAEGKHNDFSDGALTPLGEELQKPCPRCSQPWIRHDCPIKNKGVSPSRTLDSIPACGVSQWMEYGKKYHYTDFWEKKIRKEAKEEAHSTLNGWCCACEYDQIELNDRVKRCQLEVLEKGLEMVIKKRKK